MDMRILVIACTATYLACKPTQNAEETHTPKTCTAPSTPGTPLRLLTRAEYNNTVRDLLGDTTNPAQDFPREPLAHLLDNDASLNQVKLESLSQYLRAAEALSSQAALKQNPSLLPCDTKDLACGQQFIQKFGQRIYRRPLWKEELTSLNTFFAQTLTASSFNDAVERTLQVMLQSPQFLYRDEQPWEENQTANVTLSSYQLATRLSYFLWATTPDEALLNAAKTGVLNTQEGLRTHAQRMLNDPRVYEGMLRFFSLWLAFNDIATTEKNRSHYPQYTRSLPQAWRKSLELYVRDVLENSGTLPTLLLSNFMYTNNEMQMYGPSTDGSSFVRSDMPGTRRSGILMQPAFLAFKAFPDGSAPVRRGMFVLDQLLCEPPPPPPANVAITPPEPSTHATTRERFKNHSADPACFSCHQIIDPVGFVFEHYDGLGMWRSTENGKPIDATGAIVTSREKELIGSVSGAHELVQKLAKSRRVHACLTKEVYRFALGRQLTAQDECILPTIADRFFNSGGSFKELFLAIVESNAFQTNRNPEVAP